MWSINVIVLAIALIRPASGQTKYWRLDPRTALTYPRVSASANYIGVATIVAEPATSSKIPSKLKLRVEVLRENGSAVNECALAVRVLNRFGLLVFLQITMLSDDRAALTWIDNNPMIQYAPPYLSFWLLDTASCEHANRQIEIRWDDGYVLDGSDKYFSLVPYGDHFDVFFPNEELCRGGGGGCRLTMSNDGKLVSDLVPLDLRDLPALWQVAPISAGSSSKGHVFYRKHYHQFQTLYVDAQGKAIQFKTFNTSRSSSNNNYFSTSDSVAGFLGFCFKEAPRRLNCTQIDQNLNPVMNRLIEFDADVLYARMLERRDGFFVLTVSKDEVYTIWKTLVLANGYISPTTVLMNVDCEFSKFDVFAMNASRCVLATCARPLANSLLLKDYSLRATCF